jgi:hypothetical protein
MAIAIVKLSKRAEISARPCRTFATGYKRLIGELKMVLSRRFVQTGATLKLVYALQKYIYHNDRTGER